MIKRLTIRNYALIKSLEFFPSEKLSVITGETGAGKSIMLGALGLLLGNRADMRVLWDENEKCITEAEFEIANYSLKALFHQYDLDYTDRTLIRREISPGGKSRAFINDTPVTLDVMKVVGSHLVDVHSQHETLQLASRRFQLSLIDAYAGSKELLSDYEQQWQRYLETKEKLDSLRNEAARLMEEADYVQFQLQELTAASLTEDEQGSLEEEAKRIEHTEEIKSHLKNSIDILQDSEFSSVTSLTEVRTHLHAIQSYAPVFDSLYKRLESAFIELQDIISELENEEQKTEYDPERARLVTERLDLIYRLMAKHHVKEIKALLDLQSELKQKAELTANLDSALAGAEKDAEKAFNEVNRIAGQLTRERKKTFKPLCAQLIELLHELGIPEAQLIIDHLQIVPGPSGADDIEVLFSANKGITPRPLAQVASGGEFARLMFSIKYVMAEKMSMPSLILDEIDSGISGEIALRMGGLMKEMSARHQVITITHLPQIAARGAAHFFVFKDNSSRKTISNIRTLTPEERIEEIARMIGGDRPSKIALENAKELLFI